jgi:hypothetical protein
LVRASHPQSARQGRPERAEQEANPQAGPLHSRLPTEARRPRARRKGPRGEPRHTGGGGARMHARMGHPNSLASYKAATAGQPHNPQTHANPRTTPTRAPTPPKAPPPRRRRLHATSQVEHSQAACPGGQSRQTQPPPPLQGTPDLSRRACQQEGWAAGQSRLHEGKATGGAAAP